MKKLLTLLMSIFLAGVGTMWGATGIATTYSYNTNSRAAEASIATNDYFTTANPSTSSSFSAYSGSGISGPRVLVAKSNSATANFTFTAKKGVKVSKVSFACGPNSSDVTATTQYKVGSSASYSDAKSMTMTKTDSKATSWSSSSMTFSETTLSKDEVLYIQVNLSNSSSKNDRYWNLGTLTLTCEDVTHAVNYTVTLHPNGGTGDVTGWTYNSTTQVYTASYTGTSLALPTTGISKAGYSLAWKANSNLSGDDVTSTGTLSGAADYYAKWTEASYNITYQDKGGSDFTGTHADNYPTTHTYGTATTLDTPTKTGYTFGGYFKTSDCSGTALTSLGATDYTADIPLYAKWTAKQSTITIDANTANHGSSAPDAFVATYGETLPTFTAATGADGYDLTGYYTAATDGTKIINADGTLVASTSYADTDSKWAYDSEKGVTLYAQYKVHPTSAQTTSDGKYATGKITFENVGELEESDESIPTFWYNGVKFFSANGSTNKTIKSDNNKRFANTVDVPSYSTVSSGSGWLDGQYSISGLFLQAHALAVQVKEPCTINVTINMSGSTVDPTKLKVAWDGVEYGTGYTSSTYGNGTAKTDTTWTPAAEGKKNYLKLTIPVTASEITANTNGVIKVYFSGATTSPQQSQVFSYESVEIIAAKKVSYTTEELTNVKVDGTSISSDDLATLKSKETLTLTTSYTSAPTMTFVKKTTTYYTDGSNDGGISSDYNVTPTKGSDNYTGTYTITPTTKDDASAQTTYTVNAPINKEVTLSADKTAVSLAPYKIYRTKTSDITITGSNLTGDVTLALASEVEGLSLSKKTITPTDGSVNEAVTVTYTAAGAVAEGSVNLTISSTGATDVVIPVTYSATAPIAQTSISAATTWKWSDLTANTSSSYYDSNNSGILLSETTSPSSSDEFVLANMNEEITVGNAFDAQALIAIKCQYPVRTQSDANFLQGYSIKFTTSVPGKLSVTFSHTSASKTSRGLLVNGASIGVTGDNTAEQKTFDADVTAGDVILKGYQVSDNTDAMLRFYKITFTPAYTCTITKAGWASLCLPFNATIPENVKAYYASEKNVGETTTITLTRIVGENNEGGVIPAGQGVVVKDLQADGSTSNSYTFTAAESATAIGDNLFVGTTKATTLTASKNYVLSGESTPSSVVFGLYEGTSLDAYKAYLPKDKVSGAPERITFNFEEEATPTALEATTNEEETSKFFQDGQIFIRRNGCVYTVTGQIVK